jgi:hypothetical protein
MKLGTRNGIGKTTGTRETNGMQNTSQLFLVRLWPDEEGRPEWCGKVQHVMSGEAMDFRDWPMLIARLQAMLPTMAAEISQDHDLLHNP